MSALQFRVYTPRVVRLPQDVTWDLWSGPQMTAYRLLASNGEYVRVHDVSAGKPIPLTVSTWAEAQHFAHIHGAAFVVCFKDRKVLHGTPTERGMHTWLQACVIPHDSIEQLNHAEYSPKEPEPHEAATQRPRKKRPSGAANRKKYGYPR